jgi:hypothetical protein
LKHGRYYSIPVHVASELQRAGYVQITNNIDEMGNVREVAVSPAVTNRETAEVRKIKPRRRKVKANVSGDSN